MQKVTPQVAVFTSDYGEYVVTEQPKHIQKILYLLEYAVDKRTQYEAKPWYSKLFIEFDATTEILLLDAMDAYFALVWNEEPH